MNKGSFSYFDCFFKNEQAKSILIYIFKYGKDDLKRKVLDALKVQGEGEGGEIEVYPNYPIKFLSQYRADLIIKLDSTLLLFSTNYKNLDLLKEKLKEDSLYEKKIICIYISCDDYSDYKGKNLLRSDFLNFSDCPNDIILKEFNNYLKDLEYQTYSFDKILLNEYTFTSTLGLYRYLSKKTSLKGLEIVSAREGDYPKIFEKDRCEIEGGFIYLELSNNNLYLKVQIKDNYDNSKIREECSKLFLSGVEGAKDNLWQRPKKMGYGQFMSIAIIDSLFLDEYVNLDLVLKVIKKASKDVLRIFLK